ncbi:hypothetical protein Dsin_029171 [Dipteronia sinensis]|uniref:RNase H type-1 domain-containing protein n=1 Tax=Dipteronia sinensis TaxID=43782 RepID=A0AAE0DV46_9ROSI|nr:hypothetical protein Dsin_029171 [Dipteronia sinensis]
MVNREAFMRVIGRIWHVYKGVEIESLTGNIFSFQFKDLYDRSRVLLGALWTFDNALLMLEEPVGKGSIEKMAFNMCDFWVQIYQVPLLCSSREIVWFLGEMIGVVLDVDGGLAGDGVGKFLRVRVRIDITKPLRRCLRVDILGDGVETIMLLRGLSEINDHNNTSCSKVDTDSKMMMPTSSLNEVQDEERNVAAVGVITDTSMIDALKIAEDLDSLKSDNINGYDKGIKDCKDLEGVSEILGSHKSSDFNANIMAINAIKSGEVEFPAVIDISKQVEESVRIPLSQIHDSINIDIGLGPLGGESNIIIDDKQAKAQIVSHVSLGLTDQPKISSVIRNPIDKPSTRVWSRTFRSATIGDFRDNLVVAIGKRKRVGVIDEVKSVQKNHKEAIDSRESAFYNCLEEEVSLHCSRIAEVVAAPIEVSAVFFHEDGYYGRMCTVDAEVLVTQQGVSDAAKGVENQRIHGNFVQKRSHFYFEECWVNKKECTDIVLSVWNPIQNFTNLPSVLSNIVTCGSLLDSWNASKKRELRTNILIRRAASKEANNAVIPASWRVISSLVHHLNCALDTEERYWRQCARIEWLHEGDRNTRFFHSKASVEKNSGECDSRDLVRFHSSRMISDNSIIGFECLHRLKRRKRKFGSMAIKFDMAKAYDRVEWNFIEGFSSLIGNAVSSGKLSGFKCSQKGQILYHIFFADDSLIFPKANEANCVAIREILVVYAMASGQVVNLNKSAMCINPFTSAANGVKLASIVGVNLVNCLDRYLGLPCFTGRSKRKLFSDITDKVWNKIKGLLSSGLRWRVGTCSAIKIYLHKWVLNPIGFKILSSPTLGSEASVDQIISPSGGWNAPLINCAFSREDARAILKIPLGSVQVDDMLVWHYKTNRCFTVNSGYMAEKSYESNPSSSDSSRLHDWWSKLWKLSLPLKIKLFIWKACLDWIPTMLNLASHGRIGLSIVIRDHSGAVMAFYSLTLAAFFDANTAETMAIYRGFIFSRDCGLFPCVIESDAAIVVKWINKDGHRDSISGNILAEISALVSGLHVNPVSHIPRLANNVTHGLAKFALMVVEDRFWMEEFPPCVRRAVQLDMPTEAPFDSSTSKNSKHQSDQVKFQFFFHLWI